VRLLLFTLDDTRFAIRAEAVHEIVRAVAVTPLPNAPAVVLGIVDVRGTIVPVFDLRRRFGLRTKDVGVADHFILARSAHRTAALHVDTVLDLVEVNDADVAPIGRDVPVDHRLAGVATLPDGMALIHDLDAFLSAAERDSLELALAASGGGDPLHR
jgi:purine-binding chemotaxis protein CheW